MHGARVQMANDNLAIVAGTGHASNPRGFHAVPPEATRQSEQPFRAEVSLELVGTSDFAMAPTADDTRV
jgi:inner membrane protein involved in colicin E2 resistance